MRTMNFSGRNLKEMLRDPINMGFGLGFPLIVLLLLTAIKVNIPATPDDVSSPATMFELANLTPGIAIFGLSFISLFSGMLIARDRTTSFLARLFASPMTASDYILGYTMPLIPMSIGQTLICYIAALILGLEFSWNILLAIVVTIPAELLFIGIGLLCGTVFTDRQVGGVCGALLTNLTAWLSGTWFSLELVGGAFKKIADLLPFSHAVNAGRAALSGNYSQIFPDLWWVIGYAAVILVLSVVLFNRKMKSGKA